MSEAEGSGTQPAGRDPQTSRELLFTRLLKSASVRSQVESLTISPELDELPTDIQSLSHEALGNLLLRAVNGKADLPAQKVTIQYLKNDQKLRIPAALGMNAIVPANARCKQNATLIDRYKKASLLNYQQLREIVEGAKIAGDVQKAIDDIPAPAAFTGWKLDDDFYQSGIRPDDLDGFQDVVFATLSIRLQFNCDIRDLGMLTRADSNVSDSAWKDISAVGVDRLICKLHPFSLQSIAALNLNAVAREPLAAYVRSYGLGIGILPSSDSVSMVEYTYTVAAPDKGDFKIVTDFGVVYKRPLVTPCAQLLAMFGLLHLAKDHIYSSHDSNMDRIGKSYIRTLRTDMDQTVIDSMCANVEPFVRTAQHPFGLAQTYWLARVLAKHGKLVVLLAVKLDVTPPPVQQLMITHAARMEWHGLSVGNAVDAEFSSGYAMMDEEVLKVKANSPAYSAFHRLYGVEKQMTITEEVARHVKRMKPAVYGYVMVNHRDDNGNADGLALAFSLKNVERDARGVAAKWERLWDQYLTELSIKGIVWRAPYLG